jgi:hypothetical protein
LQFARRQCDERAGNPHKEALRLGVDDKKGLGKNPETFLPLYTHSCTFGDCRFINDFDKFSLLHLLKTFHHHFQSGKHIGLGF